MFEKFKKFYNDNENAILVVVVSSASAVTCGILLKMSNDNHVLSLKLEQVLGSWHREHQDMLHAIDKGIPITADLANNVITTHWDELPKK